MGFTYKPLWDMLERRGISRASFLLLTEISVSTINKLKNNDYVSMEILDRICEGCNCDISDVMKHVK